MQPNTLIVVCQVFYPDPTSTSQLFTDLLQEVVKEGMEIEVLCGYPPMAQKEKNTIPAQENLNGIKIVRCGLPIRTKSNLWLRGLSYGAFLLHTGWKLLFSSAKTEIFAVTNPPFLAHLLYLIFLIKRNTYSYMFLDLHPEGLIALESLSSNTLLVRLWKKLNHLAYHKARKLAVLGRDMIPLLQENYQLAAEQFSYIPHWSGAAIPFPIPFTESTYAKKLNLQSKFVVQYSGNMGLWHDIDIFVRVAEELKAVTEIQFLFIGNGIRRTQAENLAKEKQLSNILWLDFVPQSELKQSLACCHVALISLREKLEGVAVPSKLYGILASGRAILAQVPQSSEIALVVEEEECGKVIPPQDVDALSQAIRELARSPKTALQMGENGFRAYQQKYTLQQATKNFLTFFSDP